MADILAAQDGNWHDTAPDRDWETIRKNITFI